MIAAIASAGIGHQVTVFEKNEKLGKKLFITGKGRCNVTNACDMDGLMEAVIHNSKFLYSSFSSFDNQDMMRLLEECGCPLKTERGNRVYPVSDKSSDVIRALAGCMEQLGVQVRLNTQVEGLCLTRADESGEGGKQHERVCGLTLKKTHERIDADAVIIATGGLSYPSTGATGDGYEMARKLGHTVTELSPALVPLTAAGGEVKELQGLSLRNVSIRVLDGEKELYSGFGEMLFTHFGVSGPLILSASSFVCEALRRGPLTLSVDLKPALSIEQFDARVLREFQDFANKQFHNALSRLYPSKLIPLMIRRSGIPEDKKVHAITRQERQRLLEITKELTFALDGMKGYSEAVITQGGVSVREIIPSTMESRYVQGVYFAGEVLDLDAVTGGYNLQIAWSTGHLAGSSVPYV